MLAKRHVGDSANVKNKEILWSNETKIGNFGTKHHVWLKSSSAHQFDSGITTVK